MGKILMPVRDALGTSLRDSGSPKMKAVDLLETKNVAKYHSKLSHLFLTMKLH